MFFATELHPSGVYVSQHAVGLFDPSELVIRARKIALHGKNLFFRCAKTLQRQTINYLIWDAAAHASTATATASLYFLSAWYCSALPPR